MTVGGFTIGTLRERIASGRTSHEAIVSDILARASEPSAAHVFTALHADAALAAARHADAARAAGVKVSGLAGLPVSVKDLFDIAGQTTLAGSVVRSAEPAAQADATAVARLRAAGAAIVGKTNMTEFAFSGVGLNPHYGTPVNPADPALARIPGGSSSGAAVSVALGLAVAALGSDTGGSLRIPAALCGLVGFKGTQRRVPLDGAFPLSHTLDTVGAITSSVGDALLVDGVLAGAVLASAQRPLTGRRLALPLTMMLDAMEPAVSSAFERALSALSAAGAVIEELRMSELAEIALLNAPGGFSAVEAYATHGQALATQRERFDPRVAARIALGGPVSAADYIRMQRARADWIGRVERGLQEFDALVCPTVPIVAPPIDALRASDDAFFKANALLLRNTFAINFLDGCAFSLPCHRAGELPVGLMLAAPGGHDALLGSIALAAERVFATAP
jgi:aspartyl-tRNA(Asn)/glutamyl-tRNA(Gln) amidotransferase subunit A